VTEPPAGGSKPPPCLVCEEPTTSLWAVARDVEYETIDDRFAYWLCEACDALSIDPVPRDRLAEIYPPTYYAFAGGADALARDRNAVTRAKGALDRHVFRRILREAGDGDVRVLDVGGGTGDIAAGFVEAGGGRVTATVVDIDPETTEVARGRGLDAVCARFEELETEMRYDVIAMLNLVEHVEDPVGTLRHARDLLAEGGVVWIQTPNWRSLDARIYRRHDWAGLHCPRHWVLFSRTGLASALAQAGLAPRRIAYTQAGAFWAASALARATRRQPGRCGRPLVAHPLFLPLAAAGAAFDFATRPLRPTSQQVALAVRA
jgi:SAM-dependent methyltransferase